MAARLNARHQETVRAKFRFYVYEIHDDNGHILYVGKGSGRRMHVSAKKHGGSPVDVAWFKSEKDAYQYEVKRIAEVCPANNIHVGGNGARAARRKSNGAKSKFEKLVDKIGTRAVAARLWLIFAPIHGCDLSELDRIRQVAHG